MADQQGQGLWYVRKSGQIYGPFPVGQIARAILLGRTRVHDELSTDGEHWQPLSALPQLMPVVMQHSNTEEGRQRLLLARLREDERQHERRRGAGYAPVNSSRRHGDRRTVESFYAAAPRLPETGLATEGEGEKEPKLLLPAAVILITLFVLTLYFLW